MEVGAGRKFSTAVVGKISGSDDISEGSNTVYVTSVFAFASSTEAEKTIVVSIGSVGWLAR